MPGLVHHHATAMASMCRNVPAHCGYSVGSRLRILNCLRGSSKKADPDLYGKVYIARVLLRFGSGLRSR